jgi:hypothetical protein
MDNVLRIPLSSNTSKDTIESLTIGLQAPVDPIHLTAP